MIVAALGLQMLSLLLIVVFVLLVGNGGRTRSLSTPGLGAPVPARVSEIDTRQYANTYPYVTGVHQVASDMPCWPAVWVGPSQSVPMQPAAGQASSLRQRRRPSGLAVAVSGHGGRS